ncbi:MAG: RNA-binding protein [Candidatus Cloacimonetes bacterium]|nr:RNA-binding protein [Candidatus Cloacimonadota bacterium]HOH79056.1 S4 domain-containing protein [Candidatus Cloacimonadota bacterium]HPN40461.1 S4 domain-containing protein [Candidatus Cloacimonadota bacterium]
MRIDLLLNKLCLTKTRGIAKTACDKGLVSINGKPAKASATVNAMDVIELKLYGFLHELRVDRLPEGNVAKKDAASYYSLLKREPIAD